MDKQKIAQELVKMAKELMAKKGEVPEAFKKQWKNKDKDNDVKENEPKPDFLKKKKSSELVAGELVKLAKELVAADTFKWPDCESKVLEQTGYCVKCKKKVKEANVASDSSEKKAALDEEIIVPFENAVVALRELFSQAEKTHGEGNGLGVVMRALKTLPGLNVGFLPVK